GLSGNYTVEQALILLLSGTDIRYTIAGNTITLSEAEKSSIIELTPILVQGEILERALGDVQTSVTVASGETLTRRGDKDIDDLIKRLPNVTQTGGGGFFSIRGVSQSSFVGGGGDTANISVQVDGAETRNPNIVFPNWDVKQIEVLRGPQSTQQGRNSLAGAIVIRTNDPEFMDEYRFRGGVASDNFTELSFVANKVLDEDTIAFRIAGQRRRDDSYVSNSTLGIDDADRTEYDNYRAKLRFTPNNDLDIVLSHSFDRTYDGIGNILRSEFPDNFVKDVDLDEFYDNEFHLTGLRLNYALAPGWQISSETTYRDGEFLAELALAMGATDTTGESDAFQQDLRLSYDYEQIRGAFGLFYYDASSDALNVATTALDLSFFGFGLQEIEGELFNAVDTKNWAVFAEAEFDANDWMDGITFVVGARYDNEEQIRTTASDVSLVSGLQLPLPILGASSDTIDIDFNAFLPKLGVIYEIREGLTTSLTFQQGYRAGGARRINSTLEVIPFDPEYTDNIEFAFRGEFFEGNVTTSANVYFTSWEDQQVQRVNEAGDGFIDNAGESEMYGAEITADYIASETLMLNLALGYSATEFTDYLLGEGTANVVDLAGNEFPNAPRWTASLGGEYDFENGFALSADVSFTDGTFGGVENLEVFETESYTLFNAALTYDRNSMTLGLYVRNLFDKRYAESYFGTAPPRLRAGEPRVIGGYIQWAF
ncbi:MAG: TonB-dependent receptor, partial [Pseudomonadota bacterium]